jgi:hypothetical protein
VVLRSNQGVQETACSLALHYLLHSLRSRALWHRLIRIILYHIQKIRKFRIILQRTHQMTINPNNIHLRIMKEPKTNCSLHGPEGNIVLFMVSFRFLSPRLWIMNCRWKHSGSVFVAFPCRDDEINDSTQYTVMPSGSPLAWVTSLCPVCILEWGIRTLFTHFFSGS